VSGSDLVLSGYLVTGELGQGGQARVVRAAPAGGGPEVAIKLALDPRLVQALRAEGGVLRRLEGPRFVRVLAEHLDEDPPFVVLELCPGGDLRQRLRAAPGGRLEPDEVERLLAQILEGVAAAHDEGIVHADLKPENVLLDAGGAPKLADLGLSRADRRRLALEHAREGVQDSLATEGKVHGTFDYLAPELRAGRELSTQSDVYALGVLLYELLTGQRPVGLVEPPGAVVARAGGAVPPRLDRVCLRALARDPRERYPDAGLMLEDLRAGDQGIEVLRGGGPRADAEEALVPPIPDPVFFAGLGLMIVAPAALLAITYTALSWLSHAGGPLRALELVALLAPAGLTGLAARWVRRRLRVPANDREPPPRTAAGPAPREVPQPWRRRAGERVGPWTLRAPLGRGGFSEVWRATAADDPAREVALKVVIDPEHADGLRRDASSLVRLRGEGIVRVVAIDLAHEPPWLALELLRGGSLRDLLRRGRPSPSEGLRLFERLLELLAIVHREGIVHGDLKPENVLFDGSGAPRLSDFGLSRRSAQRTATLSLSRSLADLRLAGTVEYVAPEVRQGARPSPASDVFALGVLFHELLLGDRPQGVAARPEVRDPRLPPLVGHLLRRMLAADPLERLGSAREVLRALRAGLWHDGRALSAGLQGALERASLVSAFPVAWLPTCGVSFLLATSADGPHVRDGSLAFAAALAVAAAWLPVAHGLRGVQGEARREAARIQAQRATLRAWRELPPEEARALDRSNRRRSARTARTRLTRHERVVRLLQRRAVRAVARATRGGIGLAACLAASLGLLKALVGAGTIDGTRDGLPWVVVGEALPVALLLLWIMAWISRRPGRGRRRSGREPPHGGALHTSTTPSPDPR
jgi:serine/threonine protein kinase